MIRIAALPIATFTKWRANMRTPVVTSNNSSCFFAVRRTKAWRTALSLIVIAGAVWLGFHWLGDEPRADKSVISAGGALPDLRGAAATRYLREQGLYDSLQEAVKVIPYQVRRVRQDGQAGQVGRIEPKPLPGGPAAYEGRNPAQQFNAYFTSEGLRLRSGAAAPETWQVALTLRRVGYGARAIEVAAGEVKAANNRVEIRRESQTSDLKSQITEWYVNDPGGLEHGFTLAAPPPLERDGERLRLVMTLGGDLQARAADDGQSVALRNRSGEHTLHYSGLVVTDATGRELEARLMAAGNELAIEVDDAAATYPVVIDPTFVQQQRLTANDGAASDLFGVSVALSGDTALIGAIGNGVAGAAYVFVRSGSAWTFQQKLTPADGAAGDDFGRSVALSGNTALVGAYRDDIGVAADRGSAYVFVRSGTAWSEQQKLTASDGAADDNFGFAVALEGDTALIGSYRNDIALEADRGAAYVFARSGAAWTQQQKLTASDGAAGDLFGCAVALSGETALVGARSDDFPPQLNRGSAYVFVRSGANWAEQQKLTASDGVGGDQFGTTVALSGDTALVSAPDDDVGADINKGSAYVFVRSDTTWTEQQKLTGSDGDTIDEFGNAVALSGDTALIGSQVDDIGILENRGSAYVFARTGTTWSQRQKIAANDGAEDDLFGAAVALSNDTALVGAHRVDISPNTDQGAAYIFAGSDAYPQQAQIIPADGAADDFLGVSVAISGDTALIGAPEDDIGADEDQGSVYVFVRSGAGWTQQQEINAADGGERDLFGWSVSLSGDTALIGAFGDEFSGAENRGSAYVYVRSGASWSQQAKLTAADGAAGDAFGFAVAVSGDTALAGAYLDDLSRGAAYVFTRSGTAWSQQQKLTGSDSVGGDQFGFAVALSGDTALVGAPSDDVGLDTNQGSAYVFTRSGMFWSQQQKLTDSNGGPSDQFGQSVALSGETALIGAPFDNIAGVSNLGSAFVYVRSGEDWSQQAKLTAPDGAAEDQFGNAVALSGETALIGSHLTDLIPGESGDQGAAHIFQRSGASWTRIQKLLAGNGAPGDEFGYSVAISGDTAVVGAPSRRIGADVNQGTAYIFDNCPGDITINPMALPAGQIGAPYNQNLTASGGFAPYAFSVIAGALPANMTLSAAGVLSGAPTQFGVFNFTVQAADQNGCSGSRVYALTINSCPPIAVNPASLPAGTVGAAYNQALSASGGGPRYTLSVTAGALPTGLSLTAGGVLLGVPRQTGAFNFTIRATDANGCMGARAYTLTIDCATITVNPATPPNGTVGSPYNQTITASGGVAPHTFAVTAGALPNGLMLSTDGTLSGSPTAAGAFNFTVQATDSNRCRGARPYSMTISDGTISGLQYYLLPAPIRLFDTRPGSGACDAPGAPLGGGTTRTQPARTRCSGVPANALAITGNATVVNFISDGGHITLFPSNAAQPLASNLNFTANHIVSNSFTVGLGGDGAFNIFTSASTDFIVDLTGYYAPPGAGGLYFHSLPSPVRLLDTRPDPAFPSCFASSEPLAGGGALVVTAAGDCGGAMIPASARALVGNGTVVNSQSPGGYITLFPEGAPPNSSNLNFTANQVVPNAFVVGLAADGTFNVFANASTDFIVDVTGYFSDQAVDVNGQGLLFYPLPQPMRLLDTRPDPFASCVASSEPFAAGSTFTLQAQLSCEGQTIPAGARSAIGAATVVNFISGGGYITLFSSDAEQPVASNLNFTANHVVSNSFVVGLGNDGAFRIFTSASTDFIVDLSGYFAP